MFYMFMYIHVVYMYILCVNVMCDGTSPLPFGEYHSLPFLMSYPRDFRPSSITSAPQFTANGHWVAFVASVSRYIRVAWYNARHRDRSQLPRHQAMWPKEWGSLIMDGEWRCRHRCRLKTMRTTWQRFNIYYYMHADTKYMLNAQCSGSIHKSTWTFCCFGSPTKSTSTSA